MEYRQIFQKVGIGTGAYVLYLIIVLIFEVFKGVDAIENPSLVVDILGIIIAFFTAFGIMLVDFSSRLPLALVAMITAFLITGLADYFLETTQPNIGSVNPWEDAIKTVGVLSIILFGSLLGKNYSKNKNT